MNVSFLNHEAVLFAISKMALLAVLGYFLFKKELIVKEALNSLSSFIINICFPALILVKITSSFSPGAFPDWWLLPCASVILSGLGFGLSFLACRGLLRGFESWRELTICCAFQNGAYLPMSLIAFADLGERGDQMMTLVFLFMLGFNLTLWSFVPGFFAKNLRRDFNWFSFLNPPVAAILIALLSVFFLGNEWIPRVVFEPLDMLGEACFPLVLIVLGAFFAEHKSHRVQKVSALSLTLILKLLVFPLLMLFAIKRLAIPDDFKMILFIESLMPTAVTVAIIGEQQKADNAFLSSTILYSHLAAIVTTPLWFYIFDKI